MFALFNLYVKGVRCHSSAEEIKLLKAGVSLFIRLRGINGTFLLRGLRTDFKRKLDLTVVAIPPKAGTLMR